MAINPYINAGGPLAPQDLRDTFDGMIELTEEECSILEYTDEEYEDYREARERECRYMN